MFDVIKDIHEREVERQNSTYEFIASENFASQAVMDLCGSVFTNKYAEGYPAKRYYNGCAHMDEIETLAIDTLTKLYDCEFANVQPHCGANANTAIYSAFLKPGDRILGMDLASGGHLSHGAKVNISGKIYESHHYGVQDNGWLDYQQIAQMTEELKPKMIVAGASAYPRRISWAELADIAHHYGAYLLVDMAHYSGLIAGGVYPSPISYADFVTSTTHKTLRGPRGGIILWNNLEYTKAINSAIFPGTQGGPLMNIIAAKAQAFLEADTNEFSQYAADVVQNAKAMAETFMERGYKIQTDGTDSHIILVNLVDKAISGKQAADALEENGITVNKNGVPNDPRSFVQTSGIRLGTAAETTKGHTEDWFITITNKMCDIMDEAVCE